MSNGYSIFAQFYDTLTQNIDYKQCAQYYDSILKEYGVKKNDIVLDLACGTGSLSEELDSLGYDVIAVDNSPEMLNIAMNKKFKSGKNIQYICQDMRNLDLYGNADAIICSLDSLNHLNNLDDVKKVFERVHLFCNPDGIFIFDINTEFKHKVILGNHTFIYDTEDVYCVWQNTCINSRVLIELDFFVPNDEGHYNRYEESFYENAYSLELIESALRETGFEILLIRDGENNTPVSDTTQRAVYCARKIEK